MMPASFPIWLITVVALAGAAVAQGTTSPYAGQQQRPIKALSEEDMRDLEEARGMGLAKAAELNSYPGPVHVLQLAKEIELSASQRAATEALYADMRGKAQALGRRIIEAERALDQAFAAGRIEPATLRAQVDTIAMLQGELRAVHLGTHLAQRALLTPEQVARYDRLRGYGSGPSPAGDHSHPGGHPAR
jgi:Spy/CpxP family protein refolding chaperone